MNTDRNRFFQNEPIQNNSCDLSTGINMGTEICLPLQGHMFINSSNGICEGISSNLLSLLNLNIDQVVEKPVDQILSLEAGLSGQDFIESLVAESDETSGQYFYSNIYTPEANYDCLVTVLNNQNQKDNDSTQLLFIIHIPSDDSSTLQLQKKGENENWVKVKKGIHKLNNVLTAFYCHWDLITRKYESETDIQEASAEITDLLDTASDELRNLTLTANNQITINN